MSKLFKLGVIGSPIDHSLSPFIHSRFARQENINIDYRAYKIEDEELQDFIKEFFSSKEARGLNVTLPHKQSVTKFIRDISGEAKFIDAINTISKHNNILHGSSSDGDGLINDLKSKDISIENKKILIIGAGSAVRSILFKLIKAKPDSITIINRTSDKAKKLQSKYLSMMPISIELDADKYDLVINGSSAGLTGSFIPPDENLFHSQTIFYDLNYSLTSTPFCSWAETISKKTFDGTGMLVSQAAISFAEWFGVTPDIKKITDELIELRNWINL